MSDVYILHAPLPDLFKVGYSNNVEQRLDTIRRYSPCLIELVATFSVETTTQRRDGLNVERRFHERYLPYRAHAEWFHRNPLLSADISAMKAGTFNVERLPTDLSEASLLRIIRRGRRTGALNDIIAEQVAA